MEIENGYRPNVGIIILNADNKMLVAKRIGIKKAWQFPQGGVNSGEDALEAMHRELYEELGLGPKEVEILEESAQWYRYKLPSRFIRHYEKPLVIGQRQKWFLLRLLTDEKKIALDKAEKPEFDEWKWADAQFVLEHIIPFKREVYQKILKEFKLFFPHHTE